MGEISKYFHNEAAKEADVSAAMIGESMLYLS